MNCPRCGNPLETEAAFCSICGLKIAQATRSLVEIAGEPEAVAGPAQGRKQGCRTTLTVVGVALAVVLLVGLLIAGAVYLGLRDRESAQANQAQSYFEQGEGYFADDQYELAIAAYDQALLLDPDHPAASSRRSAAQAMLDAGPTDTPALQEATIEALWQEHQQMVELEEWARVLETGEDIILRDPSYRRTELDDHLFRAFMGLARESIAADRPEEALRYLDRALSIVPQSPEAVHLQNLTSLYLDGMRFYGADWPSAIDRLAALYAVDPNYKDAADRLLSAYISYAQQLETEGKWCEAAAQYGRAMEISSDSPLVALRQNAEEECTLVGGTATPEGPTEIPSGSYAGRELQPEAIGSDKMSIHGHVFDSSGEPVAGARVEIKAWDFTAYAVTDGSGQFSFDGLANAAPYTLTLVDLTSLPIQVETEWGRLSWVVFEQAQ